MPRDDLFTVRLSKHERALLRLVAEQLARSQSDTVRWLILQAARQCELPMVLEPRGGKAMVP